MNNIIKDKNQILVDSEFININLDKIIEIVKNDKCEFWEALQKLQNNVVKSIWNNFIN